MPLDRSEILLENLRESLGAYQRGLYWSMTASSAFILLSLRMHDTCLPNPSVLGVEISPFFAWLIAFALFFVLGGYTLSMIQRAEIIIHKLNPREELKEAIFLSSNLATNSYRIFRVGSVLYCPVAIFFALLIALYYEGSLQTLSENIWLLSGLLFFDALIFWLYIAILKYVWQPFGFRFSETCNKE